MKTKASRFAVALSLAVLGLPFCVGAQIGRPVQPGERPRALTPEDKAKAAQKLAEVRANLLKLQEEAHRQFLVRQTELAKQLADRQAARAAEVRVKLQSLNHAPPVKANVAMPTPADPDLRSSRSSNSGGVETGGGSGLGSGSQPTIPVQPRSSQPSRPQPPPPRTPGLYSSSGGTTQSGQLAPPKTPSAVTSTAATGPVITSLTHNQGQPGDAVGVIGSGFGNAGEVHFILHNNVSGFNDLTNPTGLLDYTASTDSWNDAGIGARVPAESLLRQDGYIYVIAGGKKSNQVPFRFSPTLESVALRIDSNHAALGLCGLGADLTATLTAPLGLEATCGVDFKPDFKEIIAGGNVSGAKGDDKFFQGQQLRNDWVVEQVQFIKQSTSANADCAVAVKSEGTSSPYVDVHWWVDAGNQTGYVLIIWIRGPKGVPIGI